MCLYVLYVIFVFFKQKTAYEMRISDWSSDVCSSDLCSPLIRRARRIRGEQFIKAGFRCVLDSDGERYDLWTDFYVSSQALESRMDDIRGFDGVINTTWQNGRAVSGGGGEEPRWMALTLDGMPDV